MVRIASAMRSSAISISPASSASREGASPVRSRTSRSSASAACSAGAGWTGMAKRAGEMRPSSRLQSVMVSGPPAP
jgi:hypothetical protein